MSALLASCLVPYGAHVMEHNAKVILGLRGVADAGDKERSADPLESDIARLLPDSPPSGGDPSERCLAANRSKANAVRPKAIHLLLSVKLARGCEPDCPTPVRQLRLAPGVRDFDWEEGGPPDTLGTW